MWGDREQRTEKTGALRKHTTTMYHLTAGYSRGTTPAPTAVTVPDASWPKGIGGVSIIAWYPRR